jgi:hypothetical protein
MKTVYLLGGTALALGAFYFMHTARNPLTPRKRLFTNSFGQYGEAGLLSQLSLPRAKEPPRPRDFSVYPIIGP